MRVNRSVTLIAVAMPRPPPFTPIPVRSVRFVVSTTSVSPSQCPRESPSHSLIVGADVRPAVERHDPRLVNHLVDDRDVTRRLHDLIAVVVDHRQYRARDAARDAPIVEAAVRVRIRGPAASRAARSAAWRCCAASVIRRHAGRSADRRSATLAAAARRARANAAEARPGRRRRRPACL